MFESQSTMDGAEVIVMEESPEGPYADGDQEECGNDTSAESNLPPAPAQAEKKFHPLFIQVYGDSKSLSDVRALFPVCPESFIRH
jgi:hypothetical protein